MSLSASQMEILKSVAARLGVTSEWLWIEINFETNGTFSPTIKNPKSSARGLIQWIDARAQDLGFSSSLDLVNKNPTVESQLELVYRDLKRFMPFPSFQSLAMAVFRPSMRYVHPDTPLPANIQSVNDGIRTVGDYVSYAVKRAGKGVGAVAGVGAAAAVAVTVILIWGTSNAKG